MKVPTGEYSYHASFDFHQASLPQVPRYQASRAGHDYLLKPEAQTKAGLGFSLTSEEQSSYGTY